jgi:hypothetical protein
MTNALEEFIPFSANSGMDDLCLRKLEERKERTAINRIYRQCPTMQYFTDERSVYIYIYEKSTSCPTVTISPANFLWTEKCVKILLHLGDACHRPNCITLEVRGAYNQFKMVTNSMFLRFFGHLKKNFQLHCYKPTAFKGVIIMNE